MTTVTDLNGKFGKPGAVAFERRDGSDFVKVTGRGGEATVSLQGAQVLSWVAADFGEMLWWSALSPAGRGTAIRGGIPICWPWFGPHAHDASRPMHGLVRTAFWSMLDSGVSDGDGFVVLTTQSHGARLRLRVDAGAALEVKFEMVNEGREPLVITEALHTYFAVGDVARTDVVGLDGCSFRDRTNDDVVRQQSGALSARQETNAHFDVTPDALTVVDHTRRLEISIQRSGGASTVVWNPGASATRMADVPTGDQRSFLCVESGNVGASAVTVAPGTAHRLGVRYTVRALTR